MEPDIIAEGWDFDGVSWWYRNGTRARTRGTIRKCEGCARTFVTVRSHDRRFHSRHCRDSASRGKVGQVLATKDGYLLERVAEDDPLAVMAPASQRISGRNPYVLRHRLVYARHLGRPIASWEEIHHINGDRSDNRISNLQLRVRPHGAGQVARCSCCGSRDIVFEELAA